MEKEQIQQISDGHATMIGSIECSLRENSVVKASSCMPKEKHFVKRTTVISSKDEMSSEIMLARRNIGARKAFKLEELRCQGRDIMGELCSNKRKGVSFTSEGVLL